MDIEMQTITPAAGLGSPGVATVIPEPSVAALAGGGFLGLVLIVRSRRRAT